MTDSAWHATLQRIARVLKQGFVQEAVSVRNEADPHRLHSDPNPSWLFVALIPAVAVMSFVVIPREEQSLQTPLPIGLGL